MTNGREKEIVDAAAKVAGTRISTAWIFGVIFFILKVQHDMDWSWWWVTAPFWGSAIYFILAVVRMTVIGLVLENKKQ